MGLTAQLTSKRCILCIYSTNIGSEYLKHALYSPFFSLRNAVCFIMLTCLVPVLFTFYIQCALKLKKKNNSGAKGLTNTNYGRIYCQLIYSTYLLLLGDRGGTVVKVLCYKSEGRWFDLS